jgi:hypothetical protein
MTLLDEPAGWHRLHAMAQNAPDAQSLARIVAEMNRILVEYQKALGSEPQHSSESLMGSPGVRVARVTEKAGQCIRYFGAAIPRFRLRCSECRRIHSCS